MKKHYCLLLLTILTLFFSRSAYAQDENENITGQDTASSVTVHADPRVDILLASDVKIKKNYIPKGAKVIRSAKGFRVQIYNGSDKNMAIKKKVDFMRRFPSVKTYMTYTQPVFRIKVGDFETRKDAQIFMSQISGFYSPVMIVPDYIVINTFHK